ncbi:OLC1v1028142C1 [Oldenlandia corymbosa var. corymbosa]|uniref:Germin-like protein n=1 Tax=Oldenlandia corymbosa var. corymbosa TaxID=529605 RepID=A0AAV1CBA9_OLDCO|nr:OLC1v1028142C1 [Oldenlandia corymbosa var. corymbosa]
MKTILQLTMGLILLVGLAECDPDPLQDYCVASTQTPPSFYGNGVPCIHPQLAKSSHFATSSLSKPGNTDNQFGFNISMTNTTNLPGMNTLGLAMARLDIGPDGIVPLHSHPRASEVTILLKGTLFVGFVDGSNRLFNRQLRPGDSFVFPKGLIHYLYNMDKDEAALALSGFSSQNPGLQISSFASFVSKPGIPDEVLEKSFKIHSPDVAKIRRNLGG